jgi:hypothetical protein
MAKRTEKPVEDVVVPAVAVDENGFLDGITPEVIVRTNDEAQIQNVSNVASTEYRLLHGEQVERYYPLFPGETMPCRAFVTINGFTYWFEKGKSVRIPLAVAEVYDRTVDKTLHGSRRMAHKKADRPGFMEV